MESEPMPLCRGGGRMGRTASQPQDRPERGWLQSQLCRRNELRESLTLCHLISKPSHRAAGRRAGHAGGVCSRTPVPQSRSVLDCGGLPPLCRNPNPNRPPRSWSTPTKRRLGPAHSTRWRAGVTASHSRSV
jgi:hypothetical protein